MEIDARRRKKMGGRGRIGPHLRSAVNFSRFHAFSAKSTERRRTLERAFTDFQPSSLPISFPHRQHAYILPIPSAPRVDDRTEKRRQCILERREMLFDPYRVPSSIFPRIRRIKFKRSLFKSTLDKSSRPRRWKSACNEPLSRSCRKSPFFTAFLHTFLSHRVNTREKDVRVERNPLTRRFVDNQFPLDSNCPWSWGFKRGCGKRGVSLE